MSDDSVNEVLVEKLRQCMAKPTENLEQLRSITARLHSRAASQDKQTRELTLDRLRRKKNNLLPLLLTLLENIRDHVTAASVAGIIYECIAPKSGTGRGQALSRLVDLNATNVFVKMIMQIHSSGVAEPLLQELVRILGQLAQKDCKFSLKVRLLNGVKTFHYLLRVHYQSHNKMLVPVLIIIKTLARNANTTALMVKDGIAVTMEKAFIQIGFSPNARLRLLLSVFNYLSRNSRFCTWMVKTGSVQLLVKMFERWEHYDGKMRLKICSYTLLTLQHVCSTRAGRSVLRSCNGLSVLYKFCTWCPDDKVYDPLLTRVCSIISLCIERKELPVESQQSPAQFTLPVAAVTTEDDAESGDDESEDDGEEDEEVEEKETPNLPINLPQYPQRNLEDLKMYASYWCELPVDKQNPECYQPSSEYISNFSLYSRENTTYYRSEYQENSLLCGDTKLGMDLLVSNKTQSVQNSGLQNINSQYNRKLKTINDISAGQNLQSVYCQIASRVHSVLPFVKVAYPDMVGSGSTAQPEQLNLKDRKTCRAKLLACVERSLKTENAMSNVVYDLDQLLQKSVNIRQLSNCDESRVGCKETSSFKLLFESRFESGNLRKAIQVGNREYDLILMPDVNSSEHLTWFYFEVANMDTTSPYTFNIINCEKANSQLNFGMKPVLYSVKEAMLGRPGWIREGSDICYYRNSYPCSGKRQKKRTYLTATFTIKFPHNLDVCYIAYHYPYTYSHLLTQIWSWKQNVNSSSVVLRAETLCQTLNNNETPVLTITAPDTYVSRIVDREIIFLTARVHPGESNSSWVMQGCLEYLLGESLTATRSRNRYIFKIVPMLNPEGVINGCYRCGLTNEDLNRRWSQPNPILHPVIYHTKGLIDYAVRLLKKIPYVFCDLHGHSRRKNVFLYGCSNQESWLESDRAEPDVPLDYLILPNVMANFTPGFSLPLCKFCFERHKEATARVTVWREFGVKRSYTMECSFCGFDTGVYKGFHMNTGHLKEIGTSFCVTISCLYEETQWRSDIILASQDIERVNFQVKDEIDSPGVDFNEYADHSDSSDTSEDDFNHLDD